MTAGTRRRGGPLGWLAVDLVRSARRSRRLVGLLVVVVLLAAAVVAVASHAVLPWAVYPAL